MAKGRAPDRGVECSENNSKRSLTRTDFENEEAKSPGEADWALRKGALTARATVENVL